MEGKQIDNHWKRDSYVQKSVKIEAYHVKETKKKKQNIELEFLGRSMCS